MRLRVALLLGAIACALPAAAATLHVPGDQPTIQAGIGAAAAGDTLLLAHGIYLEHDIALTAGLTLLGDPGEPEAVVIDGEQLGGVLHCESIGYGPTTVLAGLTVRNGLRGDGGTGGGLATWEASVRVSDCIFANNTAAYGGGVGIAGFEVTSAEFTNCRFESNTAAHDGGGAMAAFNQMVEFRDCRFAGNQAGSGAGLKVDGVELTLSDCSFTANVAAVEGGGLDITMCPPEVSDCVFESNQADRGGGLSVPYGGVHLTDCVIRENAADYGGGVGTGLAGIHATRCLVAGNTARRGAGLDLGDAGFRTLSHCTIVDNRALAGEGLGGALYARVGYETLIEHCTLAGNGAATAGGGIALKDEQAFSLVNSLIAFSSEGESLYREGGADPVLSCADIFGNAGGDWVGSIAAQLGVNGNLAEEPRFCGIAGSGNYYLQSISPCAPANNGCGVQIGALPVGCDVVSVEASSWGAIKTMY
jgi:hypothetical protein